MKASTKSKREIPKKVILFIMKKGKLKTLKTNSNNSINTTLKEIEYNSNTNTNNQSTKDSCRKKTSNIGNRNNEGRNRL